ncbi:LPS-assembly lipoprotein LptE [Crenobacter luteus]|uniref:LPS-assembly lipoprotein LptE n=1 Tax=Crenobacter luteus TaxID=1452487 RepID=UPI0009EE1F63|nr:LPS assembly lipoprotein LptE [Crenobacter luteus]
MRFIRKLLLLASLFALTACGFQLRGLTAPLAPLPFASVYLDGQGAVMSELGKALARDPRLTVATSAAQAEVVLRLSDEASAKDILTINRAGRVNEYLLTLRVTAELLRGGERYGEPRTVIVRRRLAYFDSAVLAKEEEESFLWRDMRRDAADQLARSLAYMKPLPAAAQQSLKPAVPRDAQPVR